MERFDIDMDGTEECCEDGRWVRFEDADAAVSAERARIRQLLLAERDRCLETSKDSAEDYGAAAVLTRVAAFLEDR